MATVEFEDTAGAAPLNYFERPPRGLVALVLKTGLVKTEKQVLFVFLGIIVCAILYMGYYAFKNPTSQIIPASQIMKIDQSKFAVPK